MAYESYYVAQVDEVDYLLIIHVATDMSGQLGKCWSCCQDTNRKITLVGIDKISEYKEPMKDVAEPDLLSRIREITRQSFEAGVYECRTCYKEMYSEGELVDHSNIKRSPSIIHLFAPEATVDSD